MRLYVLELARHEASGSPVPAYLIQTDDGSNVLVDTGFPRAMIGAYRQPGGPPFRMDEGHYVVNALAALGVAPADIRHLVVTHLDSDHAGALDAFPDAELVIRREAYEAARGGDGRHGRTRDQWSNPALRFRLVDGDTDLLPGVELIASSGHAPGHQAALVRPPETGPILLAIDAIPRQLGDATPEGRPLRPFDADPAGTRASTRRLVDLAARAGAALTIHGHDPAQWPTLKKAPDHYE